MGAGEDRFDEVRQRLAALDDPATLLEGLFAHSPIPLQIYKADGHSLLTNRAFRELFGSEPPPSYNVLHDDIAAANGVLDIVRRAFDGEVVTIPPVWYDARELKTVRVTEGRRVAISATFFPLFGKDGRVGHVAIVFTDLTREMQALAEAEAQRTLLEEVLRQMPAGVVIGEAASGKVLLSNALADKLVGATAARTPRDGFPLRRALGGESLDGEDYTVTGDDGLPKVIRVSAGPVRSPNGGVVAAVSTFYDVTEHRRAEEVRRVLAEAGRVLAASLDPTATLQAVAQLPIPAMADWCAVEVIEVDEEAPNQRAVAGQVGVPDDAAELHRTVVARVVSDGLPRLVSRTELGSLGAALAVPLATHGRIFGAMTLVRDGGKSPYDPHDLEHAGELARHAALAVDNARLFRAAQDALHARETFVTIASHELKTPLAVLQLTVQAFARSAARREDPVRVKTATERVMRNVERLTHIVDDLLDCSRMMAGRLQFNLETVDLGVLAREVVTRLAELAMRSESAIQVTVAEDVVGRWDRTRLDQVLTNLLTNALKYGGGAPIDVVVEGDATHARLSVRDRGIGIDAEDLTRIFEPFERAAGARYAGTGLGLWIVKQIVEALGGTIGVASDRADGTTFSVTLPRRPQI